MVFRGKTYLTGKVYQSHKKHTQLNSGEDAKVTGEHKMFQTKQNNSIVNKDRLMKI